MATTQPTKLKTRTIVLAVVLYTFVTNLDDVRKGFIKGWNDAATKQAGVKVKTT